MKLIIELGGGNYFVQVKYNGEFPQLPGCSSLMCPIDEFLQLASSRIPTNFNEACGINTN